MVDLMVSGSGVTVEFADQEIVIDTGENTQAALSAAVRAETAAALLEVDLATYAQGLMADAWVSSESGSDSATGLSLPRAKQTLAAAEALFAPTVTSLALATRSVWREDIELDDDYEVVASGAGDTPLIDGADIVTGWTLHATQPNVYQVSFTHEGSGSDRLRVFEDDVPLVRVANVAACNALAGSFVDAIGSGGPTQTIYIRPNLAGDPDATGALIDITKRLVALGSDAGTDVAILGPIETRRAVGNNGSLALLGAGQVSRHLAVDGSKHAIFVASGLCSDSIAWRLDNPVAAEVSNTFFVAFMTDPTGFSARFERCGAVQPDEAGTALSGHSAFYAHNASPVGTLFYDEVITRQCWAVGPVLGGHSGGGTDQLEEGCYWNALAAVSTSEAYDVRYALANLPLAIAGAAGQANILSGQAISDSAYWFEARDGGDPAAFRLDGIGAGGTGANGASLDHCAFAMGAPHTFNAHAFTDGPATSGGVTCNNSVIAGFTGNIFDISASITYAGDYNIFYCPNEFTGPNNHPLFVWQGVAKTTLADWQTASGEDANSCYARIGDQTAGGANALWLAWAEAPALTDLETVGPAVGDFRINPSARVYSGANTAFIGTFPDGTTLITEAGPQRHWDWNRREATAGAPTHWPRVPTTLEQGRIYIRNPAIWDFAP